jgi:hypothetical protein
VPAGNPSPFQYSVIRVVPRVERGECFNAGVVLLCRPRRFLAARVALDERRLAALAPHLPPGDVQPYLDAVVRIAAGASDAGPIAQLTQAERFHWLSAPSSTIIQPSAVHTGLTEHPAATLDHLFETLVLSPSRSDAGPVETQP